MSTLYRELLLGCGFRRERYIDPYRYSSAQSRMPPPEGERWQHVTAVDCNPACKPDIRMDLSGSWYVWAHDATPECERLMEPHPSVQDMLQFSPDLFDEVHAYEVLEHLGQQGDERSFFAHFEEIWRVLKPDGFLCATVPSRYSPWLWGDPGHRRAILPVSLVFLNQAHYLGAVGTSPSSDYRGIYRGDFVTVFSNDDDGTHSFILQAIKPARRTTR